MVFEIVFDNGNGIFGPGDEVKGIAKYSCNSAKTVRGKYDWNTKRAHIIAYSDITSLQALR